MERSHAVDICEDLVTAAYHIWEILDEKDTPRVFSRIEVDILRISGTDSLTCDLQEDY